MKHLFILVFSDPILCCLFLSPCLLLSQSSTFYLSPLYFFTYSLLSPSVSVLVCLLLSFLLSSIFLLCDFLCLFSTVSFCFCLFLCLLLSFLALFCFLSLLVFYCIPLTSVFIFLHICVLYDYYHYPLSSCPTFLYFLSFFCLPFLLIFLHFSVVFRLPLNNKSEFSVPLLLLLTTLTDHLHLKGWRTCS